MNRQKLLLLATVATVGLSASIVSAADKETKIIEKNGDHTTVRTTSEGTRTTTNGKDVYTAGGDRHKEQVDHSTNQGGKVVSEKTGN